MGHRPNARRPLPVLWTSPGDNNQRSLTTAANCKNAISSAHGTLWRPNSS